MTRPETIRHALDALAADGRVRSWYCYAPGDRGRVWVVETPGTTRSLTTREVETFIAGAGS
jgi:hypothetical protein